MEFGVAQVVDIIFRHWFLINLTFQLSEFEDEDEEEGSFSIKVNHDVKNKRSTTFFQAKLIDVDISPQT
jgi:hypothetical protein